MEPHARHYRVADEFAALTDSAVAAAVTKLGIERTSFGDLPAPAVR
jgi:RNA-binding protein YlmH